MDNANLCNICFDAPDSVKCQVCRMGMCPECQYDYFASCLDDTNIPQCINPKCDIQFTITQFRSTKLKPLVPKLVIATKSVEKMDDQTLTQVEIENKVKKLKEKLDDKNKKLVQILPAGLQTIATMVHKTSQPNAIKKEKKKLQKEGTGNFRECPRTTCTGFINMVTMQCSVCDNYICDKCNEIKKDEHKCNKDTLESLKAIQTDSKKCPKCKIPINRSQGCDYMWCTNCKTNFSYSTGEALSQKYVQPEETAVNFGKTRTVAKIHSTPVLGKKIRDTAPENLLVLFDSIYPLLPEFRTNNAAHLKFKLQMGKINIIRYDKDILKAYEKDYLNRKNKKLLIDLGENLLKYLGNGKFEDDSPEWLQSYYDWRTIFNNQYSIGYKLP